MVDGIYAQIGAEIRRRREGLGLSQAQLAEKIDVGRTSITMIERGAQAVLVHHLIEIAKALKVSPDKLINVPTPADGTGPSRELYESAEALELLSALEPIGRITR